MVRCGVLVPKTRVDAVPIEACSHQLGTEFSCVILLGFKEGLIPMHSSKLKVQQGKRLPTNVDEERRLAYVAMTRPKSKLFILGPVHGMPQAGVASLLPWLWMTCFQLAMRVALLCALGKPERGLLRLDGHLIGLFHLNVCSIMAIALAFLKTKQSFLSLWDLLGKSPSHQHPN
eukprot:1151371-Pelagomonas_calceolata.AAC.2